MLTSLLVVFLTWMGVHPSRAHHAVLERATSGVVASLGERLSHNHRYSAEVVATTPLSIGVMQSWTIHIGRRARSVVHASIAVDVWMPETGIRSPRRPTAQYIGHGDYRIDSVYVSQPGWWNVALVIEGRMGRDSVAFNVVLVR